MVRPYSAISLAGENPMMKPEMIAAISMPVPVNDRYVNANTAPSCVGLATTGGTLSIMLCRPGTGKFQVKIGLTAALNQPVPQISSTAQTMIHGSSAAQICGLVSLTSLAGFGGGMVAAESSWLRSAGDSHSSFGRQIFRKPIRQAMEMSDAPMSTIHGLMKFEIRNCGIAKE